MRDEIRRLPTAELPNSKALAEADVAHWLSEADKHGPDHLHTTRRVRAAQKRLQLIIEEIARRAESGPDAAA